MNDTRSFEFKVYFEDNKEEGIKKAIFKNFKNEVVHTTKYRVRKIKQPVNHE